MQFQYDKKYQLLLGSLERVSHDVNNYCTAILYHVETLKGMFAQTHHYQTFKSLNLIVDKVVHLSESLTRLASSEEVDASSEREPTNLRLLLEEMLSEGILARDLDSTIHWRAPIETMSLDRAAIERVFYNLFVNAIEAKDPAKAKATLTIEAHQRHNQLVLVVSDEGVGLGKRKPNELFEPNYSTKGQKGRGLGLAIAKEIIESHDGGIAAKERTPNGMQFIINFGVPKKSKPSQKTLLDHKRTKVLLITSDPRIETFFARAQEELPFQLLSASTNLPMNIKYQEFDVLFYDTESPISLQEVRALLRHKVATYKLQGHSKGQVQVSSEANQQVIGLLNYHFFKSFFGEAHAHSEEETLLSHLSTENTPENQPADSLLPGVHSPPN